MLLCKIRRTRLFKGSSAVAVEGRDSRGSHGTSAARSNRGLVFGDLDGFGRYGILDEDEHGQLLCHLCGAWLGHLGLHVYKAHGVKARDYRIDHGLRRTRGLISAAIRSTIQQQKTDSYSRDGALATARNPARASQSRLAQRLPASAEEAAERDARMSQVGRLARLGRVITCGFCGVQFCPLHGSHRRLYCSRRCAGRAIRAKENHRSAN